MRTGPALDRKAWDHLTGTGRESVLEASLHPAEMAGLLI